MRDHGTPPVHPGAEKGRQNIFGGIEAVIGEPGEVTGRTQGPLGVVDVQAKLVDPGETLHILEAPAAAEFA